MGCPYRLQETIMEMESNASGLICLNLQNVAA